MGDSFGDDEDVLEFEGDVLVDRYKVRHQGVCQQMLIVSAD